MDKIHEVLPADLEKAQAKQWLASDKVSPLYSGFDIENIQSHAPDIHLIATNKNGVALGRCSLWWTEVPELENEKLVVLGHYAVLCASDEDSSCADQLFEYAATLVKRHNGSRLVGPMDGNTWHSYRFVTKSEFDGCSLAPFFLEPQNPDIYPRQFLNAGFKPLAKYISAINTDLAKSDPRIDKARKRFADQGILIRTLKADDFDNELKKIFQLSVESFVNNYLYTPVTEQEFLAQYQKVKSLVVPEMVLLATDEQDNLLGYAFALPDIAQKMRGEAIDTIIIKTVAVKPGKKSRGLGSVLVGEVQRRAHEAGFKKAIHALMHQSNTSTNISRHYAETFREYTLFSKSL